MTEQHSAESVDYDQLAACVEELTRDLASVQIANEARRIYLRNCESNEAYLVTETQKCYARVAELETQLRILLEASTGVLVSFENYSADKPEDRWDEYDEMMNPKWKALRAAIARVQEREI